MEPEKHSLYELIDQLEESNRKHGSYTGDLVNELIEMAKSLAEGYDILK